MSTVVSKANPIFASALRESEEIVWAGAPARLAADRRYLIPFLMVLIPAVIICYWVGLFSLAAGLALQAQPDPVGAIVLCFCLAVLAWCSACVILVGRNLLAPNWQVYAVTSQRLFWLNRFRPKQIHARQISESTKIRRNGSRVGTLVFANLDNGMFQILINPFASVGPDRFVAVDNPRAVEDLIANQISK